MMKKFTKTLSEAKALKNKKPGSKIFKLKAKRTATRNFFVGTEFEWLNL